MTRALRPTRGPWQPARRPCCTDPRVGRCSYSSRFFYCPQKLARCQHLNSKSLRAREVPDIMRDNSVRSARNREFKNKFVAGVRKERSQPKVNIGLAAEEAEGANDRFDGAFRDVKALGLPFPDCLVFDYERH